MTSIIMILVFLLKDLTIILNRFQQFQKVTLCIVWPIMNCLPSMNKNNKKYIKFHIVGEKVIYWESQAVNFPVKKE